MWTGLREPTRKAEAPKDWWPLLCLKEKGGGNGVIEGCLESCSLETREPDRNDSH